LPVSPDAGRRIPANHGTIEVTRTPEGIEAVAVKTSFESSVDQLAFAIKPPAETGLMHFLVALPPAHKQHPLSPIQEKSNAHQQSAPGQGGEYKS
jgi:hypothetical protein